MPNPAANELASGPGPMVPQMLRLARREQETADTYTLELVPAEQGAFRFVPGQFNMLSTFGQGESAISISGDPTHPERLVHTVRAVGAVTRALCSVEEGGFVGVRGPFGHGWPVARCSGSDVVIIAGGIGLAPLRPVIYQVLAHRGSYGRIALLYGARRPEEMLFRRELAEWRGRFDMSVDATVDQGTAGWFGNVGVVTELIPRSRFDPDNTVALVCGPEVMMRFTARALLERGLAPEQIYLSMERNMKCGIRQCGRCQLGPTYVCTDGPVYSFAALEPLLAIREL